MFNGAELEQALAEYAVELGGVESKIRNPKNEYKTLRVFKAATKGAAEGAAEGRIFLIIHEGSDPLVIDFFIPTELQQKMIEQYETASASQLIDKKRAVQLVLTDQFDLLDLKSFILQSLNRVD